MENEAKMENEADEAQKKDTGPVWMYRQGESKLFDDAASVPKREGWTDSPAKVKSENSN